MESFNSISFEHFMNKFAYIYYAFYHVFYLLN